MELLFIVIIAIAIVETILSSTWNRAYFSYGIPIFSYEPALRNPLPTKIDSKKLEYSQQPKYFVALKVHRFSDKLFGVREAAWGGFGAISYTPIMHGKIEIRDNGQLRITGLVNWFTVFFTIVFIGLAIQWGSDDQMVFVLPAFLFCLLGWIYITQKKRFIELADIAASQTSDS